jgi:hypothetical protein
LFSENFKWEPDVEKIKDVMLLDLTEDIKDVIDVEQQTEDELQFEIENYIVTNKIAEYFSDLINLYRKPISKWHPFYGTVYSKISRHSQPEPVGKCRQEIKYL